MIRQQAILPVFLQFPIQRSPIDAQNLSSLTLMPMSFLQAFQNVLSLEPLEIPRERLDEVGMHEQRGDDHRKPQPLFDRRITGGQ